MSDNEQLIKQVIEAALMASGKPLSVSQLLKLFTEEKSIQTDKKQIVTVLDVLKKEYESRGIVLHKLASGYTFLVNQQLAPWISQLWLEKPPKYSRAVLETLVIIAYKQPVTRGDIENIRGVAVSSHIIKTLLERKWLRVVGQRDVPGKPSLYATTNEFLDYFGLARLEDLPPLPELLDLDTVSLPEELPLQPALPAMELQQDVSEEKQEEVEEVMV